MAIDKKFNPGAAAKLPILMAWWCSGVLRKRCLVLWPSSIALAAVGNLVQKPLSYPSRDRLPSGLLLVGYPSRARAEHTLPVSRMTPLRKLSYNAAMVVLDYQLLVRSRERAIQIPSQRLLARPKRSVWEISCAAITLCKS